MSNGTYPNGNGRVWWAFNHLLAGPTGQPVLDVITTALNVAKTAIPSGSIPSPAQAVGPTPAAG